MKRKLTPFILVLLSLMIILAVFGACSKHLGRTVPTPEIFASQNSKGPFTASGVMLALDGFKDVRASALPSSMQKNSLEYTQPQGGVETAVDRAFEKALTARGAQVVPGSDVRLWGEVRKWRTWVDARTTVRIESEASIYIEVLSTRGDKKFSGSYHGSRTSQFPIANASDIQFSLAQAMEQAINQAVSDEEFLAALRR